MPNVVSFLVILLAVIGLGSCGSRARESTPNLAATSAATVAIRLAMVARGGGSHARGRPAPSAQQDPEQIPGVLGQDVRQLGGRCAVPAAVEHVAFGEPDRLRHGNRVAG